MVRLAVRLFDSKDNFCQGLAYKSDLSDHFILNVASDHMANFTLKNNHITQVSFSKWLRKHHPTIGEHPDIAIPRSIYGQYMKESFAKLIIIAKTKRVKLVLHYKLVTNLKIRNNKPQISTGTRHITFDKIVLATGHGPKQTKKLNLPGPYYPAYPPTYLDNCMGKTAIILGTSLTAVETAITLAATGCKKAYLISRHGLIPHVKGQALKYKLQYFTLKNLEKLSGNGQPFRLKQVISLLKKELLYVYHIHGEKFNQKDLYDLIYPQNVLSSLKQEINLVESGSKQLWRGVLNAHESIRQEVYERLHIQDRRVLMQDIHSAFMTFNAPMILDTAKKLLYLIENYFAYVYKGIDNIAFNKETKKYLVKLKNGKTLVSDIMIDGTGFSFDLTKQGFYKNAINSNSIEQYYLGGINYDLETNTLLKKGQTISCVYALGPMTNVVRRASTNALLIENLASQIGKAILSDTKNARLRP